MAAATTSATASSSATSTDRLTMRCSGLRHSCASSDSAAASRVGSRARIVRSQPAEIKRRAKAKPIPLEPPLMTACPGAIDGAKSLRNRCMETLEFAGDERQRRRELRFAVPVGDEEAQPCGILGNGGIDDRVDIDV